MISAWFRRHDPVIVKGTSFLRFEAFEALLAIFCNFEFNLTNCGHLYRLERVGDLNAPNVRGIGHYKNRS